MLDLSTSPCDAAQVGACACPGKLPGSSVTTALRAAEGRARHLACLSVAYHLATAACCPLPSVDLRQGD
jgi:hypothetical protein